MVGKKQRECKQMIHLSAFFILGGKMETGKLSNGEIALTKETLWVILLNGFLAVKFSGIYASCFIGTLLVPILTKKYKTWYDAKWWIAVGLFFTICTGFVLPIVLYLNWKFLLKPIKNKETGDQKEDEVEDEIEEKTDFDMMQMNYVSRIIQRKILDANAKGCDFFEIDQEGSLKGYQNGKVDEVYSSNAEIKVTSGYYPEICKWLKDQLPEIKSDYTEDKLIISWM